MNPAADAGPLDLSATVAKDRPRPVTLFDPDGRPVVGVQSYMRWPTRGETQEELNSATFSLNRLHPDRVKQTTFVRDDRRLIGLLLAAATPMPPSLCGSSRRGQGPGESWTPLAGRSPDRPVVLRTTDAEDQRGGKSDKDGRFRIERVIHGLSYASAGGSPVDPLVLHPGEVRDLGDLRAKPAADGK